MSTILAEENTTGLENMSAKIDITNIITRIRSMLCGDLILSHHLISTSPAAQPYLRSCAAKYAEIEEISDQVEIGLCTFAWLNG